MKTANAKTKKKMVDPVKLVRGYFPKASENDVDHILSAKTGWPVFFHARTGAQRLKELRRSLYRYQRARRLKRDICYCCGKMRWPSEMESGPDPIMCKVGERVLAQVRERHESR
jgi:hypothetical protein